MYGCESQTIKKTERFWTAVLEKTLESPLDGKVIKPVNPKGNHPWILTGRTDAEAPILWPPDAKSRLTGKDSDARKGWGQEEKGTSEDEMFGWYYWLNGHEFEQAPGDSEGQGRLAKSRTWLSNWTAAATKTRCSAILCPEKHAWTNFKCACDELSYKSNQKFTL